MLSESVLLNLFIEFFTLHKIFFLNFSRNAWDAKRMTLSNFQLMVENSYVVFTIWGFFLGGGFVNFFQSHSKGLYTDPNDCMNHPKWLFGSCETCLRHIRNYSTAENYFFRLDFRKLSPKNEWKYVFYLIVTW